MHCFKSFVLWNNGHGGGLLDPDFSTLRRKRTLTLITVYDIQHRLIKGIKYTLLRIMIRFKDRYIITYYAYKVVTYAL